MSTMPAQPDSRSWSPRPARRADSPDPPGGVSKVTTLLTVLIGLSLIGPVILLVGNGYRLVTGGGYSVALLAGAAGVTVNGLLLMLVNRVRQGRRWAWITLLVILALYVAVFAAVGIYDLTDTGSFTLLIVAAIPALMILLLVGPRRSRAYFRRDGGRR